MTDGRAPRVVFAGTDAFARYAVPPTGGGIEQPRDAEWTLVLYDRRRSLPETVRWLRKHEPGLRAVLPLSPWDNREFLPASGTGDRDGNVEYSSLLLFGACAVFAGQRPDLPVTLVSPPVGLERPPLLRRLHLRRFIEADPWADDEDEDRNGGEVETAGEDAGEREAGGDDGGTGVGERGTDIRWY